MSQVKKPAAELLDGTGTKKLVLPKALPALPAAVEVRIGEHFERLPASDYEIGAAGRELVLAANPSGVAGVWPKGKGTVRVSV